MKRNSIAILLFMAIHLTFAQSSSINWILTDGGNHDDFGTSITSDENYIYTTGIFTDTCFIGDTTLISYGARDVYISKYDKEGNFIWVKQLGNTENDGCTQILHNKGHILMTGYFGGVGTLTGKSFIAPGQSGFFLLDIDVDGNLNWTKAIEGTGTTSGYAITTDSENNIYVLGIFEDTLAIDGFSCISKGGDDIFTAKLDAEGNVIWINQAGGIGNERSTSITSDEYNNVYLTGSFEDTATFGDTTITSLGYQDIFMVKYNSSGEQIWLKTVGGEWGALTYSISINRSGQLFLAGIFGGTTYFGNDSLISNGMRDAFLASYNLSGALQWVKSWGSDEHDFSSDLATDNEFVYLSCSFAGETTLSDTILSGNTAQIIQLSNSGEILDFIQLGGYYRNKCAIDNSSALYVTGALGPWSQLYGDTVISPSSYSYDIFLTRIDYEHTGVEEFSTSVPHLKIYPNPATDFFNIEIEDVAEVSIANINGQLMGQYSFNKDVNEKRIDISGFPPGLYIITVQTKNKILSGKMIKY